MFALTGHVEHVHGQWRVKCQPDVRTRLKRMLPRVSKHAGDEVVISHTPENCRDLLWFLDRFPMTVSNRALLEQGSAIHREEELQVARILEGRVDLPTVQLNRPAREYQRAAAAHLEVVHGMVLADDLGTGKTVSAVCSIVQSQNLPALVVCPAHLKQHWQEKIHDFAPDLLTHIITKGTVEPLIKLPRRRRLGAQLDMFAHRFPDVLIVSYHNLRGWADELAQQIKLVIFDECQQLRRDGTQIYSAAQHVAMSARRRLGLSATPIHNYGSEIFPIVQVLKPGLLGEREEFLREWCQPGGDGKARLADPSEFGVYLRRTGFLLRRTRAEIGRELPPVTRVVHEIDADAEALVAVESDAMRLANTILAATEANRGDRMRATAHLGELLRQATGIGKAPYVAQFVQMLLESGEPVVLFGWHREVYSIWADLLKEHNPVFYTGSESDTQKHEAVQAFLGGRTNLLIMSLRSGAGVDGLQARCRVAVFGELDWTYAVHEQCIGRLDRDGSVGSVVAYFMLSTATDSIDPVMANVLGLKREQLEGLRSPNCALIEAVEDGSEAIRSLATDYLKRKRNEYRESV